MLMSYHVHVGQLLGEDFVRHEFELDWTGQNGDVGLDRDLIQQAQVEVHVLDCKAKRMRVMGTCADQQLETQRRSGCRWNEMRRPGIFNTWGLVISGGGLKLPNTGSHL